MLYWGLGAGGAGDNPDNLAQNPQSLFGKMTHINVSGSPTNGYTIPADNPFASSTDGVPDEIWALGRMAVGLRELGAALAPTSGTISTLVAFWEDGFGEAYLVSLGSGQVFHIQ